MIILAKKQSKMNPTLGKWGTNSTVISGFRIKTGNFLSFIRTASVQVVSKTAVCLIIQKKDVNRLIGNIEGEWTAKDRSFES